MDRLTSTHISSRIQGLAVVHVLGGRNTACLLHFEVVLETCDCFDEIKYPLLYLEIASEVWQGSLRLTGAQEHRTRRSALSCCCLG